jgi:hypothetical protein
MLEPNLPDFCNINLTSDVCEEGEMVIYDPLILGNMHTKTTLIVSLALTDCTESQLLR